MTDFHFSAAVRTNSPTARVIINTVTPRVRTTIGAVSAFEQGARRGRDQGVHDADPHAVIGQDRRRVAAHRVRRDLAERGQPGAAAEHRDTGREHAQGQRLGQQDEV